MFLVFLVIVPNYMTTILATDVMGQLMIQLGSAAHVEMAIRPIEENVIIATMASR